MTNLKTFSLCIVVAIIISFQSTNVCAKASYEYIEEAQASRIVTSESVRYFRGEETKDHERLVLLQALAKKISNKYGVEVSISETLNATAFVTYFDREFFLSKVIGQLSQIEDALIDLEFETSPDKQALDLKVSAYGNVAKFDSYTIDYEAKTISLDNFDDFYFTAFTQSIIRQNNVDNLGRDKHFSLEMMFPFALAGGVIGDVWSYAKQATQNFNDDDEFEDLSHYMHQVASDEIREALETVIEKESAK